MDERDCYFTIVRIKDVVSMRIVHVPTGCVVSGQSPSEWSLKGRLLIELSILVKHRESLG